MNTDLPVSSSGIGNEDQKVTGREMTMTAAIIQITQVMRLLNLRNLK